MLNKIKCISNNVLNDPRGKTLLEKLELYNKLYLKCSNYLSALSIYHLDKMTISNLESVIDQHIEWLEKLCRICERNNISADTLNDMRYNRKIKPQSLKNLYNEIYEKSLIKCNSVPVFCNKRYGEGLNGVNKENTLIIDRVELIKALTIHGKFSSVNLSNNNKPTMEIIYSEGSIWLIANHSIKCLYRIDNFYLQKDFRVRLYVEDAANIVNKLKISKDKRAFISIFGGNKIKFSSGCNNICVDDLTHDLSYTTITNLNYILSADRQTDYKVINRTGQDTKELALMKINTYNYHSVLEWQDEEGNKTFQHMNFSSVGSHNYTYEYTFNKETAANLFKYIDGDFVINFNRYESDIMSVFEIDNENVMYMVYANFKQK